MAPKRACDVCYKRKIQCSIPNPRASCNWCSHHDLACTFTRTKRNKSNSPDIQQLLRRIEHLENALDLAHKTAQCQPSHQVAHNSPEFTALITNNDSPRHSSSTLSATHSSTTESNLLPLLSSPGTGCHLASLPSGRIPFSGSDLGQNWYYKGMPVVSERGQAWISSKTGQEFTFDKFNLFGNNQLGVLPSTFPSLLRHISSPEVWEMPDKSVAQIMVDTLFTSSFQLFFPVLDQYLFKETIEMSYGPCNVPLSREHVSARACVLAALSLTFHITRANESTSGSASFSSFQSDVYAAKAQALLGLISGDASLVRLQTVLMLWQDATLLHSLACRIVCGLGGHLFQPTPTDTPLSRQKRHTRSLFWLCYITDQDISLRSGHHPLLTEEYCDLILPSYEGSPSSDEAVGTRSFSSEQSISHLPGYLRLSLLKEKAHRMLYSPRAFSITDSQLLLRIRQLDSELEIWRISVPIEIRPKLSVAPGHLVLAAEMDLARSMQRIKLQLEYHYLLTVIHTTVRRCGSFCAENVKMPEDLHVVVHSSVDLALEASRSTLSWLNGPSAALAEEAFWPIVFYPIVAAMSLFVNILIHPLVAQAKIDLQLVASAAAIIRDLSIRTAFRGEAAQVHELQGFVRELARLGDHAISRAKGEEEKKFQPSVYLQRI
ncbi:hypothetical protein B0T10DRAFT_537807 [Thelonectria olida]|uniref:Zn(2)-C6 fungal-type domain-containing protein n=1 Tax=Thelonectria olida TaxID=1576542 RepID=A0A9P9AME9_9HYPO|nr:hypothetical protein B0T10DRAFT_537807 [Thelonectria olida]